MKEKSINRRENYKSGSFTSSTLTGKKVHAIAPFDSLNQLPLWNLLGFIKSYDPSFYSKNNCSEHLF
jgi:hypothetical protein